MPEAAGVSVGTMLGGVKTDMLDQVGSALPVAGGVFAAIAGIMVGIKLFKKITGART